MPNEIQLQEGDPDLPIKLHAGSYPPKDYTYCEGQVLSIGHYPDLYKVIGNAYGGDGETTFAIPDFREDEKDYNGVRFIISMYGALEDMDFISAIEPFNGSEEPVDWFFCEGQFIGMEYSNLYSLIGTTYGGDGKTNFALPDLRKIETKLGCRFLICYKGVYPGRN